MSSVLSVVERLFRAGAKARAACRSSAIEPRGGMSMEGGEMMEIVRMPEECLGYFRIIGGYYGIKEMG